MKITIKEEEEIKKRLLNGETYISIAKTYNVSKECIRQKAIKFKLDGFGLKIRRKNKAKQYNFNTYDDYCVCYIKYATFKSQQKRKNKIDILSFEEYSKKYCNVVNNVV